MFLKEHNMNIKPPASWPAPPAPINWTGMNIDEVRHKIDSIDMKTAGIDHDIEACYRELKDIGRKMAINRKIGLGGLAGFAAGMAVHLAFTCPPAMIIAVAANAVSIGEMIYLHRLDEKERTVRENISELEHRKNLAGIVKTIATEQLGKKEEAQALKEAAIEADFNDMVSGVEAEPGHAGTIDSVDRWVNVDGIMIEKKGIGLPQAQP